MAAALFLWLCVGSSLVPPNLLKLLQQVSGDAGLPGIYLMNSEKFYSDVGLGEKR